MYFVHMLFIDNANLDWRNYDDNIIIGLEVLDKQKYASPIARQGVLGFKEWKISYFFQ